MMRYAITLFALLLIAGLAQAQPRAELEAWPLDDQGTWRIAIEVDELTDLFGFQSKIVFPEGNIEPVTKKVEHHAAWPQQGKIALRNYVKGDVAEYAVSLIRPAKPIELSGRVLVMDVKLLEPKPTPIVIETLKMSDEAGRVTRIIPEQSQYMIGEKPELWPYMVGGLLGLAVLVGLIRIFLKRNKPVTAPEVTV